MISLYVKMTILLVGHYLADFQAQTDWMALNKSRWWKSKDGFYALLTHVVVYSFVMGLVTFSWKFALIMFATHWITDALTSQMTTKYWFIPMYKVPEEADYDGLWPYRARIEEGKRHLFFTWIGFDQLIHGITILWTLKLLNP